MRELIVVAVGLMACASTPVPADRPATSGNVPVVAAAAAEMHVHDVVCGCALGLPCQKMISVDGKFVPLTGPAVAHLGKMAFCGRKGLQAKAAGEVVKGEFVASAFELRPAP